MINLYREEVEQIQDLGIALQQKWYHRTASKENLEELSKEIQGRYAELGFVVNVDITPALVGVGPPDVAIVERIVPIEIDHERVRTEVKEKFEYEGRLSHGKLKKRDG